MKKIAWLLLCIPFLLWGGVRIYQRIVFDIHCTDRIKRAADANTVDMAKKELQDVLQYLEEKGLTSGYTSVLYNTPDEDVGFWYSNLKASLQNLESIRREAPLLERSNMLIKLRETLLDEGKQSHVTLPRGISISPNNTLFAAWGWISGVLLCVSVIPFLARLKKRK